jgi:aminoglycoside phosphotransferase (APT) family kinase protein
MPTSAEDASFERLARKIYPGSRLLRAWPMVGGISAQVTALEIELPDGQVSKIVVRRYGDVDLQHNPHVAEHEFRLLQVVRSAGLAAPAPYYLDADGELFSRPCIAIEYVEGSPNIAPAGVGDALLQMAEYLSAVHKIDGSSRDLSFLPRQDEIYAAKFRERPTRLDDSLDEGRIRNALQAVWPLPGQNEPVLLHGDFWPGNMLWLDGRLVSVVDCEDAQRGDPLADLANSRLEILWAFGPEAMHTFTRHYRSMSNVNLANLPHWDLCAALRPAFKIAEWAGDPATERAMREAHSWFVRQAFQTISPC